jgi:membrane protease YdiL (CAAX protease family)
MNEHTTATAKIKPLGLVGSFAIFIPAALLMAAVTRYIIPYLSHLTGFEPILFWFICAGLGIFTPLILVGIILMYREGYRLNHRTWVHRLRFKKLQKNELILGLAGLILAAILSGLIMYLAELFSGQFDHSPAFMAFEPLTPGRYWLLLVWLPYWLLNILGEEFIWRGVMLPRQEVAFGNQAWIVHGTGWLIFHLAFGWQLLITLIPLIYIQSFIVQKTKNSWVGVLMHGGLNGPSFLAISFGLI